MTSAQKIYLKELPFYGFHIRFEVLRDHRDFKGREKQFVYRNFDVFNYLYPRVVNGWQTDVNRVYYMLLRLFMSEDRNITFEDYRFSETRFRLTLLAGRGAKLPKTISDLNKLMRYLEYLGEEFLFQTYLQGKQRLSTLGGEL